MAWVRAWPRDAEARLVVSSCPEDRTFVTDSNRCLQTPSRRPPTGATRGDDPVRRAPRSHQLLVPRRRLAAGRSGRAGRRARADRAGRHGPQRPLRRGPVHGRRRGGGPPRCRRDGDRAAGPGRPRPGWRRHPAPRRPRRADATSGPASGSRWSRGRPVRPRPSARDCPAIATRSRRTCAASARGRADRTSCCWPATPVGWRSLSRLVSRANLAGTKAVPALPPRAARGASRGPRRAVGLPRRRDRAAPAGRRSGRAHAPRRSGMPAHVRTRRRAVDERLLHRAVAPPAARRRLARRGVGGARGRARAAGRRHERRPLRDAPTTASSTTS